VTIVHDLRALPLFQGIAEARLAELVAAFQPVTHRAGTVIFRPGDTATHFEILTQGQVTLEEAPHEAPSTAERVRFELRPFSPLGELGAVTGMPRSTTATASTDVELLSIGVGDLLGFFDRNADVGVGFYKNLLRVVSDKVHRDRRRIEDMRSNLVRTQKAMKRMREMILDAAESDLSRPLCDTLESLIDGNRRANYRVTPTEIYPAQIRLDDGRTLKVLELSEGHVKLPGRAPELSTDPSFWTGILVIPAGEVLLSGTVVREGEGAVVVKLDKPVPEFKTKLDDYTTRVQLLDFLV
jgi:CRP-like cAMP-binding protein